MKKFWTVAVIESKKYDGTADGCAVGEHRTRGLVFENLDDAITEFEKQKERCDAVVQYASRHQSTESIDIIVDILAQGVDVMDDYFYSISYKDGQITNG